MKTITTVFAVIATTSALLAVPAAQASDRINPHTALPYAGAENQFAPAGIDRKVAGGQNSGSRANPFAVLPYHGAENSR